MQMRTNSEYRVYRVTSVVNGRFAGSYRVVADDVTDAVPALAADMNRFEYARFFNQDAVIETKLV